MTGKSWLLRVSGVVISLIAAGWIAHAWRAGSYSTLVAEGLIVAGAIYLALDTKIARFVPGAQRWRVDTDENGIILRPNLFRMVAMPFAMLILLLGFFLIGVLQMLGRLAAPGPQNPTPRNQMLLNLVPILGVVCGVLAVGIIGSLMWVFAIAGSKAWALVIGGYGVTRWGGPAKTLAWDAVRDVQLSQNRPDNATQATELIVLGEPKPLTIPLNLFPRDSAILADMVRFYWRNPEQRAELGTDLAARRWAARDFPAS